MVFREAVISLDEAERRLNDLEPQGVRVFSYPDLKTYFSIQNPDALRKLVRSLLDRKALRRVVRGVYVYLPPKSSRRYLIEEIACVIRRRYFNYVSLESILSEFGIISQLMVSRITIMTTGPSGIFDTPYGTIEFTNTSRTVKSLLARTLHVEGRPLRIATKEAGIEDLLRIKRNIDLIDWDEAASTVS
jgi:predicted transcriptional regulator of viral defense system